MIADSKKTADIKLCFILGILQRSGTNHVFRLLREHPCCWGPGPIWEDHLVKYSEKLTDYTKLLYKSWNPKWSVEKKVGPQRVLLEHFGDAIGRFLKLQLHEDAIDQATSSQVREPVERKVLLTKTPSVVGLENFFDLFPEAYLVLIVRDGRAVVESGVRSFDWKYEPAMRKWTAGARTILDFVEHHSGNNKLLLVKYEDLIADEKNTLLKIFNFLDISPGMFDFDTAKSLAVAGSSDMRAKTGTVAWKAVDKTPSFDPLRRFEGWDKAKRERFTWIAGEYMSRLGYEPDPIASNKYFHIIRNNLLDFKWDLRSLPSRMFRRVFRRTYK